MNIYLLLALVSAINAKATPPVCEVSEWSAWNYPNHDASVQTLPGTGNHGNGEANREIVMRLKAEQSEKLYKCTQEGTCPQFNGRQIDGFAECLDGNVVSGGNTYPCDLIDQLSRVSTEELYFDGDIGGLRETNDIWGWSDTESGYDDEYAIVCLSGGTSFVRITDPINPVVVGHIRTNAGSTGTTWRDAKTIGNFVYIVSEHSGHGMQVFDLRRLRNGNGNSLFAPDATYEDTGNCHNIVANEDTGYVYLVGCTQSSYPNNCGGGLHVVDVNDPFNPTFAGCFGGDGYVHDAQCVIYNGPDTTHVGREVCFCYNEDDFTIVDVEDKNNMFMISSRSYNDAMYTHQGWVTEDHTMVLLDDELDENNVADKVQKTYIWDVNDLDNPVLVNTYRAAFESIDHNQYIIGDLTYQSNYRLGLRILNINQGTNTLTEVAYFDAFPDSDGAVFNGAWSTYPWYSSGVVVTSSSEYGFFVLQPNMPAIREKINALKDTREKSRYREVLTAADENLCPALEEVQLY